LQVDTTNILFICGGAFGGLTDVIQQRSGASRIGFGEDAAKFKKEQANKAWLRELQPEDLMKFGLIPEFVGRLPMVATLEELDEEALVSILTAPKNALVRQYRKLFRMDGVELTFEPAALRAVAASALRHKTGARGLRSILERAMLNLMYEAPGRDDLMQINVTEEMILGAEEIQVPSASLAAETA
jgi:ATP-dependent Clp protease ATP-binding subunit ClpX